MRVGPGIAAVRNGLGSILEGSAKAQGRILTVPVRKNLENGAYTVRWSVVSDDGHLIQGLVTFRVGPGSGAVTPALAASTGTSRWLALLGRWLMLAGILVAAGGGLYRLLVSREDERSFLSTAQIAATSALAGGGLLFLARPDALDTRFGRMTLAGLGVAALVAFAGALGPRSRRGLDLLAAGTLVLLVFPPLAGHALDPGRIRPLAALLDVAHLLGAAFWAGGLVQLALVPGRVAARRFSSLAVWAVALLGTAGVGRAVLELASLDQLWTTGYGRALLVKTGVLLALLAVAARSRRLLGSERLRVSVALELALIAGVLAATAYLTDSRPGVSVSRAAAGAAPIGQFQAAPVIPRPPLGALSLAGRDGSLAVTLTVQPHGGTLTLTGGVISPDQTGLSGRRVDFTVAGSGGTARAAAAPCGPGCFRATLASRGTPRAVELSVDGRPVRFELGLWPPRPGAALARRATEVFRALHSLRWSETLDNGVGTVVRSEWSALAPDRLAYHVVGGGDGIGVGGRRWFRLAGGAWQLSETTPSRQPEPFWGDAPTNAFVLGETTAGGRKAWRLAMVDREIPAWFLATVDEATGRTLELEMTAAAHFMRHVYRGWNEPLKIVPPR